MACPEIDMKCSNCEFVTKKKEIKEMQAHDTKKCLENLQAKFNIQKEELKKLDKEIS